MKPDIANLIPKDEALSRLFACWTPQPVIETISLEEAGGRILAEDQYALYNLPIVRASTMDGVAVHADRFQNGMPDTSDWKLGTDFVRADTGDDFDDRFDAVIAIENVTLLEDGGIQIAPDTKVFPGSNVKPCGADVRKGTLLAKKGTLLTAADLGAIAMGGIPQVPVIRKPRVSFLPTGSELVPVGSPLNRGQNYDSNSVMVAQMLRDMGAVPILHPIVPDNPKILEEAFETLLAQSDIVLVNAGTSKGGEDYCAKLLEQKGNVLFHGVAAVPGRPMSIAVVEGKPVVNLSGPPFAAFYSMDWAIRSMICRALGIPVPVRETVKATLTAPFGMPPFFSLMASFHLEQKEDGTWLATPLALRGPKSAGSAAVLTADGVYITRLGEKPKEAGEEIEIELMRNRAELIVREF